MDRYIGIDAHSESCTVVVMGPAGKRLKQQVVDTQAAVLIDFLKGIAGNKYVCIEEGQLAEWLVEALGPYVKEMAVVQPPEHNGRKSDLDDAWALAERIRVRADGTYVFKPTTQYRALHEAMRAHATAVKERARAKNRFRALLRSRGIPNIDATIYDPESRPMWIAKLPAAYRRRAEWLGQQVDSTSQALAITEAWLNEEGHKVPEVKRLKTVAGLGDVRAAQIVALVVTPPAFGPSSSSGATAGSPSSLVLPGNGSVLATANGHMSRARFKCEASISTGNRCSKPFSRALPSRCFTEAITSASTSTGSLPTAPPPTSHA